MIVERQGVGAVPLLYPAVAAGGALVWEGARRAWQWGSEVLGPVPELATPRPVAPAAPQTRVELTQPGAFTPEEMYLRTIEARRLQQATASEVRRIEGAPGGPRATDDADEFLWVAIGIAGIALLMAFSGR